MLRRQYYLWGWAGAGWAGGRVGVWAVLTSRVGRWYSSPDWAGGCLGSTHLWAGRAVTGQGVWVLLTSGWAVFDWVGGCLGGSHLWAGQSLTGREGVWTVVISGLGRQYSPLGWAVFGLGGRVFGRYLSPGWAGAGWAVLTSGLGGRCVGFTHLWAWGEGGGGLGVREGAWVFGSYSPPGWAVSDWAVLTSVLGGLWLGGTHLWAGRGWMGGTYLRAGRSLGGRASVALHPLVRLDLRQRMAPLRFNNQHPPNQVLALYKTKQVVNRCGTERWLWGSTTTLYKHKHERQQVEHWGVTLRINHRTLQT